ncbi:PPPDE putative peptidase domain-containing protein [Gilbertella persicaria]|uniref:PPPDE putative peptidase domain-containing protein n=1 Tax=Gilbertella persicaria TaxID=101096 RepID=UPI002220CEB3|nr:PPPDE putative peptidase domain-containing protein [Gilbertella persicaria]KAI8087942.1 PPPDE putative peptidase domain-containing protein [Gilbertella persicaria]
MFDFIYNLLDNNNNTASDSSKLKVYVNVYDMIQPNYITQFGYYALGVGVFHSGVEIGGKEYCFGGHEIPHVTGVFVVEPKIGIPELTLKQTFDMGTTHLTEKEIEELLVKLSNEFVGPSYNLLARNCNHFTEEFVEKLTHKSIPSWINRAAKLGAMFPCMVPWEWIQPPEFEEEAEQEVEEEEEQEGPNSRRSSTISLLSSSKRPRSNITYQSTANHDHSTKSNATVAHSSNSQFQITKFQGIILPEDEPTS